MAQKKLFFIVGVTLAIIFSLLHTLLPDQYALDLLAVVVGGAGGVYFGIGLLSTDKVKMALQIMAAVFVIAFALLGLWFSPLFFALAFFVHGIWDIVTVHPNCLNFRVVGWYMPMCVGYDFLFAIYLFIWYLL